MLSEQGRLRQAATALGLVGLAASAVYAGDLFGVRGLVHGDGDAARPPAASRTAAPEGAGGGVTPGSPPGGGDGGPGVPTQVRSQPWWQALGTESGTADAAIEVTVAGDAIQWRATWECRSGPLVVRTPGLDDPIVDAECPGSGLGYATSTGPVMLDVEASDAWSVVIEQQVDVPLVEPPLPAMSAAGTSVVSTGTFYDIDQVGRGTVTLYRTAEGGHLLRVEDFYVTPNVDLEIRFSVLEEPRSTEGFMDADSEYVAPLDITAGAMNFPVPDEVDPAGFASVVIWCPPLVRAYAAATLVAP